MRRIKSQFKVSAGPALPTVKRPVTPSDPGVSFFRRQMAAVRREWLKQFRRPTREGAYDLTSTEITSIEARVRKELYPKARFK